MIKCRYCFKKIAIVTNPNVFAYADKMTSAEKLICLTTDYEAEWWRCCSTEKEKIQLRILNKNILTKLYSTIKLFLIVTFNRVELAPVAKSKIHTIGLIMVGRNAIRTYEGSRRDCKKSKNNPINLITHEEMQVEPVVADFFIFDKLIRTENKIFIGQPWEELELKSKTEKIVKRKYKEIVLKFNPTIYILHPKENIKSWLSPEIQVRLNVPFERAVDGIINLGGKQSICWGAIDTTALLALPKNCKLNVFLLPEDEESEIARVQLNILKNCIQKGVQIKYYNITN